MKASELREIADELCRTGLSTLEFARSGAYWRIVVDPTLPASADLELSINGTRIGSILKAGVPGRFLRRHPLRDRDLVAPGIQASAGTAIGLIAMGPVLLPVQMPADGFVLAVLAEHDRAVGYGEVLFEIVATDELRKMGLN